MSRRFSTEQKGQALAELVLSAAMLIPLLGICCQCFRLIHAKLELVQLTGQAALYLIHEEKKELSPELLRELAKGFRLDPEGLSAEVKPALFEGSSDGFGAFAGGAASFLLGSTLQVRYRFHFGGAWGRLNPQGLLLGESVAFQSGCWKNLGLGELLQLVKGGG